SPTRERRAAPLAGAVSSPEATAVDRTPPPPPRPKKKNSPAVTGTYSGALERNERRRDHSGLAILTLLAFVGAVIYFATRAGGPRRGVEEIVALSPAPADLALHIAEGPDRDAPDLAVAIAAPTPDLATPLKRRRRAREEEMPVTVFGAETAT